MSCWSDFLFARTSAIVLIRLSSACVSTLFCTSQISMFCCKLSQNSMEVSKTRERRIAISTVNLRLLFTSALMVFRCTLSISAKSAIFRFSGSRYSYCNTSPGVVSLRVGWLSVMRVISLKELMP